MSVWLLGLAGCTGLVAGETSGEGWSDREGEARTKFRTETVE